MDIFPASCLRYTPGGRLLATPASLAFGRLLVAVLHPIRHLNRKEHERATVALLDVPREESWWTVLRVPGLLKRLPWPVPTDGLPGHASSVVTIITRALRQSHRRIEGAHQAVLHDARHGQGALVPGKVSLYGRGGRVGWQVQGRQRRLRGDLFVLRPTPGAPLVNIGGGHQVSLSLLR
jgi:hypothetical protein